MQPLIHSNFVFSRQDELNGTKKSTKITENTPYSQFQKPSNFLLNKIAQAKYFGRYFYPMLIHKHHF